MLHSEIKDKKDGVGRILMNVEGNPIQIFTELYALIVAVSDSFPMEGMREKFIDEIPEMVRGYRAGLVRATAVDNGIIDQAKGETDNGVNL